MLPNGISYCSDAPSIYIRAAFESLREKNERIIREAPIGNWLPSVVDTHFEGGQAQASANVLGGCGGFYDSPLGDGSGFITLLSLSGKHPRTKSSRDASPERPRLSRSCRAMGAFEGVDSQGLF